ncbi:hypothetical protein ACPW7N_20675 [Brevibacillus sp. SYSU BS000544]
MASVGTNPYFILQPGYQLVLKGEEEGNKIKVIITVLNQTKMINGVKTRIVEEKEFQNGRIVEISRNFFAISKTNNSVFYFGEDVDIFNEQGKIVSHEGSWRAGRNGAKAGLIMPGIPLNGAKYFQEQATGVALDRSEIITVTATIQIPKGTFRNVLKIRETTPLEPGVIDFKFYARGIGLIKDGPVSLVKRCFI